MSQTYRRSAHFSGLISPLLMLRPTGTLRYVAAMVLCWCVGVAAFSPRPSSLSWRIGRARAPSIPAGGGVCSHSRKLVAIGEPLGGLRCGGGVQWRAGALSAFRSAGEPSRAFSRWIATLGGHCMGGPKGPFLACPPASLAACRVGRRSPAGSAPAAPGRWRSSGSRTFVGMSAGAHAMVAGVPRRRLPGRRMVRLVFEAEVPRRIGGYGDRLVEMLRLEKLLRGGASPSGPR